VETSKQTIGVNIVSAEAEIYSGEAHAIFVSGAEGELGIKPQHTPLLTALNPGLVRVQYQDHEEVFYISGGLLEIQPYVVTVLADTAIRAADLDESAAQEAQRQAEEALQKHKIDKEYYLVAADLAKAVAQLRAIKRIRKQ
jgi:F-type H+-transporting ATPase subunit epsilon